ncbi:MAG: mechanosensitive ion channel family protein [Bdellovibrionota bacterium]
MGFFHRLFDGNLEQGLFGNTWERWIASGSVTLAIFLFTVALRGLLLARLRKRARRTETHWDDSFLVVLERTSILFLLVVAIHFGTQGLEVHSKIGKLRDYLFFFFFFLQLGRWLTSALEFYGNSYFRDTVAKEPARATTINALVLLGDIGIWAIMVLLLLANYDVNISALVAGLGVGGVAVALALQSILGDLFASLAIVLDRPFVIGDSITVNGFSGTVERIGLKTSHLRSVTGEQLVFSNSDLLKNVVKNYKRMERRRVTFTFGLEYETPPERLDRARELVKWAVETQKLVTFDRCHLSTLSASSLDFEVVYWMETSDYTAYVNAHHAILVHLLGVFAEEKLQFAYPHQVAVEKVVSRG